MSKAKSTKGQKLPVKTIVIIGLVLLLAIVATVILTRKKSNEDVNGGGTTNSVSDSSKRIGCSSLITSQDVGNVLGVTMLNDDSDIVDSVSKLGGSSHCTYNSDSYMFQIYLYQDALLSSTALENGGTEWGFRNLIDGYKNHGDWSDKIIPVSGIGEEAYLTDLSGLQRWTLNILQDGYRIDLTITYNPLNHTAFEGENDWKVEKLKELGQLAVQRLSGELK